MHADIKIEQGRETLGKSQQSGIGIVDGQLFDQQRKYGGEESRVDIMNEMRKRDQQHVAGMKSGLNWHFLFHKAWMQKTADKDPQIFAE